MFQVTRRQFLASVAAAPAIVRRQKKRAGRLPIAFSTLGCPKWDWRTILDRASALGYAAIELRGIQANMDLPTRPEFEGTRLAQSLTDLDALDLRISDLGSSVNLHDPDPSKRAKQIDDGKRFIDLAHRLKTPYVRVFGNNFVKGEPRQATIDRVVAGLRELGQYGSRSGVTVIIESHGDFTDSPTLREILQGAESSGVALLWDAHHTAVFGKEAPAETFKQLARYIRHTHLKDSKPKGPKDDEVTYVLLGTGSVPVRDTVRTLAKGGYRGYYCFEWEKVWHPEIEEPDVAFPHYAKVMTEYLSEAGVSPS
jgi:sugar phosphate isomerase/epimerase